jgi:hypothetical protein
MRVAPARHFKKMLKAGGSDLNRKLYTDEKNLNTSNIGPSS